MFTPSFVSNVIRPGSWTSSAASTRTQTSAAQRSPARSAASPQRRRSRRGGRVPPLAEPGWPGEDYLERDGGHRILPPQDQQEIPGQQLAQARQEDEEPAPARVVPRPRLDHADVGAPSHQGQDLADTEREHRLPVDVLRLPAMAADVPAHRVVAPQVVEGRGLMAAPGRQPHRVGQVHQPAGPGDPDHLVDEPGRIPHVLEHVAGEAHVDAGVGQRQPVAVTDHARAAGGAAGVQLGGIRLYQHALGAVLAERVGEVSRAAADVHHLAAGRGGRGAPPGRPSRGPAGRRSFPGPTARAGTRPAGETRRPDSGATATEGADGSASAGMSFSFTGHRRPTRPAARARNAGAAGRTGLRCWDDHVTGR